MDPTGWATLVAGASTIVAFLALVITIRSRGDSLALAIHQGRIEAFRQLGEPLDVAFITLLAAVEAKERKEPVRDTILPFLALRRIETRHEFLFPAEVVTALSSLHDYRAELVERSPQLPANCKEEVHRRVEAVRNAMRQALHVDVLEVRINALAEAKYLEQMAKTLNE